MRSTAGAFFSARVRRRVGHSDGASIAAIYGGSVQDHRMAGLVLMSPHFIVEDVTSASIAEVRKAYDTTDLRQRLGRYHADGDATVHGWTDVWLTNDFRQWDLTEDLAYIRVPMLIVRHASSPIRVVTASAFAPYQGGTMTPKPPAGPPAATTSKSSGDRSAV